MEYIKAASTTEIPQGTMKKVNVSGKVILLANVDGKFYALDNACPHSGGSLADGKSNGDVVTCPKHGAQFNLKTGEAVGDAKILFFKTKPSNAGCYEIKIDGTNLFIGI
ncbi:MAG: Rieske 2Fe-2S domain-containing protein [Chloroflexi bacterium]|nr:Rieske 2Fe-2S domain-containing protein [Chloroflexota bacterium]